MPFFYCLKGRGFAPFLPYSRGVWIMATQNRLFGNSETSSLLEVTAEIYTACLARLNKVLSRPVNRIEFVTSSTHEQILRRYLGVTFPRDVADTIEIVAQHKDEDTLCAMHMLARKAVERVFDHRPYLPLPVLNAMNATYFCSWALNWPAYKERQMAFASLRDCSTKLVPVGRHAFFPRTYFVYLV
jgi:hypothetical protein